MTYGPVPVPPEIRFFSKIKFVPEGCWEWKDCATPNGYGQFFPTSGQRRYAHRVAWEMANGPIPLKNFVCHSCDNRLCVRPSHLFLGTCRDNLHDASKKGRLNKKLSGDERRLGVRLLKAGESLACVAHVLGVAPSYASWLKTEWWDR